MPDEFSQFANIITDQFRHYPLITLQDIYKLIFQAAMGVEHAVTDQKAARARMEEELALLEGRGTRVRSELISPDGRLYRIHLQPFAGNKEAIDAISESFSQTATSTKGSIAKLRRFWSYLEKMSATGQIPVQNFALSFFIADQERNQFPPVHHSNQYREAYQPAYRVVAREFLPPFIPTGAWS